LAVGELIGGAIGILLLIIVAYVLVGATLTTAETVSSAQQDALQSHISRLHTDISVSDFFIANTTQGLIYFNITNSGSETINSLGNMDVFISGSDDTAGPQQYLFGDLSDSTKWNATEIFWRDRSGYSRIESVHPGQLDPGETVTGTAIFTSSTPYMIEVVTGNGAYSSAYI